MCDLTAAIQYDTTITSKQQSLSCSFPCAGITISCKNQLTHKYIIHTTSLALYYFNMFQPSKGHTQGVPMIHFHSKSNKLCIRHKIKFSEHGVLYYMAVHGNVSVVLPVDGPLRVETCQSNTANKLMWIIQVRISQSLCEIVNSSICVMCHIHYVWIQNDVCVKNTMQNLKKQGPKLTSLKLPSGRRP